MSLNETIDLGTFILSLLFPFVTILPISGSLNKRKHINQKSAYIIAIIVMIGSIILNSCGLNYSFYKYYTSYDGMTLYFIMRIIMVVRVSVISIVPAYLASLVNFNPIEESEVEKKTSVVKSILRVIVTLILLIYVFNKNFS